MRRFRQLELASDTRRPRGRSNAAVNLPSKAGNRRQNDLSEESGTEAYLLTSTCHHRPRPSIFIWRKIIYGPANCDQSFQRQVPADNLFPNVLLLSDNTRRSLFDFLLCVSRNLSYRFSRWTKYHLKPLITTPLGPNETACVGFDVCERDVEI